jgi:hypothetical protein
VLAVLASCTDDGVAGRAGAYARAMRRLAAFAAAAFVFHHLPAFVGDAGDWVDLVTPFAVVAAAAALLAALAPSPRVVAAALAAGVVYVDGHGIHLAANSIRNEGVSGRAADVAHFWDERFGHLEWHVGWIALVLVVCVAEAAADRPVARDRVAAGLVVVLLGVTLFTSTVEGQDWWLVPPVAAVLAAWALARRAPLVSACAGAFALASLLMAVWAVWHGGMPEFSDVGWI